LVCPRRLLVHLFFLIINGDLLTLIGSIAFDDIPAWFRLNLLPFYLVSVNASSSRCCTSGNFKNKIAVGTDALEDTSFVHVGVNMKFHRDSDQLWSKLCGLLSFSLEVESVLSAGSDWDLLRSWFSVYFPGFLYVYCFGIRMMLESVPSPVTEFPLLEASANWGVLAVPLLPCASVFMTFLDIASGNFKKIRPLLTLMS
jgi:hypothetical protein